MKSKFVWSNNYNLDNIYNVINNEINFLKWLGKKLKEKYTR
jgi:hypothetical protein